MIPQLSGRDPIGRPREPIAITSIASRAITQTTELIGRPLRDPISRPLTVRGREAHDTVRAWLAAMGVMLA